MGLVVSLRPNEIKGEVMPFLGELVIFTDATGFSTNFIHMPAVMQTWQRSADTILCAAIDIEIQRKYLYTLLPQKGLLYKLNSTKSKGDSHS